MNNSLSYSLTSRVGHFLLTKTTSKITISSFYCSNSVRLITATEPQFQINITEHNSDTQCNNITGNITRFRMCEAKLTQGAPVQAHRKHMLGEPHGQTRKNLPPRPSRIAMHTQTTAPRMKRKYVYGARAHPSTETKTVNVSPSHTQPPLRLPQFLFTRVLFLIQSNVLAL